MRKRPLTFPRRYYSIIPAVKRRQINVEKHPVQEENKCQNSQKKRRRGRKGGQSLLSNESDADRQWSQNLSRLYQELEENQNTNDNQSQEDESQNQLSSGLFEEFFTLITQDERSLLLSCSNDFMVDNTYQSQDQTRNSLLNSNGKSIDWSNVDIGLDSINNNLNAYDYTSVNEIENLLNINDENNPMTTTTATTSVLENILI